MYVATVHETTKHIQCSGDFCKIHCHKSMLNLKCLQLLKYSKLEVFTAAKLCYAKLEVFTAAESTIIHNSFINNGLTFRNLHQFCLYMHRCLDEL